MTVSFALAWVEKIPGFHTPGKGPMMKSGPHLAELQAAVKTEVRLANERQARYELLTKKFIAYQAGRGEAPTVEEFTVWCKDVKIAIAIRKLHEADCNTNQ